MTIAPCRALQTALVAAVLIGSTSCTTEDAAPARIIDAHIHTDFTGEPEPASAISRTREQLSHDMAEAGVVGAIAHVGRTGEGDVDLTNDGVIHCASPDDRVDVTRLEAGLRSGRHRCIKIYLGYVYRFPNDSAYVAVYALAERYDVPVVFHTGDTYSSRAKLKYAHPMGIDEVAVDHPDVDFVIAHAGYPWIETAAEVAYKNPNVYIEASAFLLGDASAESREWVDDLVVEPIRWIFAYIEDPSKMLFGSDWPLVNMASYVDVYKRAIPPEHWDAVFYANAVRVFRMEDVIK